MFKKIRLWWKFEGSSYHYRVKYGIINLFKYFKVVWNDRSWDQGYMYDLMIRKLEVTIPSYEKYSNHVGSENTVMRMKTVLNLMKKVKDGDYGIEYLDYQDSEINFIPTDETEKWFEMKKTVKKDNLDEFFKKYKNKHQRILNGKIKLVQRPIEEKDRETIAFEISHYNEDRARKILFKLLDSNISGWWY